MRYTPEQILWLEFREKLRRRRLELGLTQQSLADDLELSFRTISYYESDNRRVPNFVTVVRWAAALGMKPNLEDIV